MNRKLCALLAFMTTFNIHASDTKVITESFPVASLKALEIEIPVGHLKTMIKEVDDIEVHITVSEKDNVNWFSTPSLESIQLDTVQYKEALSLSIDAEEFEQHWTITIPKSLALDLEVGVGHIEIENLVNSAEIEVGVGEVTLSTEAKSTQYIKVESGVGEAIISGASTDIQKHSHLVGSSSSLRGSGHYKVDVEVGVGNAKVNVF